jgi:hypothetical protein
LRLSTHQRDFFSSGADVVQGLVHLDDDVEVVQDVQRPRTSLADYIQVRLPHVRADKLDLGSELLSDDGEETLEGFDGAFLADPKKAGEPLVDLVDQGQVFVAFGVLDFIHTNGADRLQGAMLQATADHILDRVAYLVPGVWKASAVSFQESLRAQRVRNSI